MRLRRQPLRSLRRKKRRVLKKVSRPLYRNQDSFRRFENLLKRLQHVALDRHSRPRFSKFQHTRPSRKRVERKNVQKRSIGKNMRRRVHMRPLVTRKTQIPNPKTIPVNFGLRRQPDRWVPRKRRGRFRNFTRQIQIFRQLCTRHNFYKTFTNFTILLRNFYISHFFSRTDTLAADFCTHTARFRRRAVLLPFCFFPMRRETFGPPPRLGP